MSEATQGASQATVYSRRVCTPALRPFPNPTFEWASHYINLGLSVVPIPYQSKSPVISEWPKLEITTGNLEAYFHNRQQNIGVLVGERSRYLVDIDIDFPAVKQKLPSVSRVDAFMALQEGTELLMRGQLFQESQIRFGQE